MKKTSFNTVYKVNKTDNGIIDELNSKLTNLNIKEKSLNKESLEIDILLEEKSNILYKIGKSNYESGKIDDAISNFRMSLFIKEQLEPQSLNVSIILNNIANLYFKKKDYEEAALLHKESFGIRSNLEVDAKYKEQSLYNLLITYEKAGFYNEYNSCYQQLNELLKQNNYTSEIGKRFIRKINPSQVKNDLEAGKDFKIEPTQENQINYDFSQNQNSVPTTEIREVTTKTGAKTIDLRYNYKDEPVSLRMPRIEIKESEIYREITPAFEIEEVATAKKNDLDENEEITNFEEKFNNPIIASSAAGARTMDLRANFNNKINNLRFDVNKKFPTLEMSNRGITGQEITARSEIYHEMTPDPDLEANKIKSYPSQETSRSEPPTTNYNLRPDSSRLKKSLTRSVTPRIVAESRLGLEISNPKVLCRIDGSEISSVESLTQFHPVGEGVLFAIGNEPNKGLQELNKFKGISNPSTEVETLNHNFSAKKLSTCNSLCLIS